MRTDEKNIAIKRKSKDLINGIICSVFSVIGIALMDKSQIIAWITIVFFGIGAILLLLKYFNPNSKFLPKQKNNYEHLSDEEFSELYDAKGIFSYNDSGFELDLYDQKAKIEWSEINKLTAFKIDLMTTDEICLLVQTENGKQFEISESTKGWFPFIQKIKEKFPEISQTWEIDIMIPVFERKETELYNRNKNVG